MKLLKTLSNLPRGWRDETLQYADRVTSNGGSIATASSVTGTTKPVFPVFAWAYNASGSSSARLNARGSFYSIGQALSSSEVLALHNAVRNLQSALNRAVN